MSGSGVTRSAAAAAWLIASGAFAGCDAGRSVANPEVPNWVHRPSHSLNVIYKQPLLADSRKDGEPYERGRPTIDVEHQRLFVGSSDHGLYSVRATDGYVFWRFETVGAVQSEPLYDPEENVVYFGSNDGALYKVKAESGELLWRFNTNAEVSRKPVLKQGTLYFVNANDTVLSVDAKTGKRRWSQHRTPALGMEIAGHAGLLVDAGRVYVAFSDGTVIAYDAASGRERWQPVDLAAEAEQTLGDIPKYLDVDTTPVLADVNGATSIVVGAYQGGVFALDPATGNQLWSNPAVLSVTDVTPWHQAAHQGEDGEQFPERKLLIASTGTTGLWALNPNDGSELWRRDLPAGGTSKPAFLLGAMLITTTSHGAFLVSPLQGAVIDGVHTEIGFSMAPAAYGNRAYVLSNSGELLAFSVASPNSISKHEFSWLAH